MSAGTILVIDDEPLTRKLLRTLLTFGRFEVLEAGDAETGVRVAREKIPDCILMDIVLPGMDGLEATRVIRADPVLARVPVVAVTAFAMKGDERKALDAGCQGYITKPIDTRGVLDNIRRFLRKTQAPAPPAGGASETAAPRILVTDDDAGMRKLFSTILRRDGYTVVEASGGEDTLEKALSESPDLVLLDVKMRDMDGYEVTRRLKGNLRTMAIPVVLVTGLADVEHKVRGLEAGADEFLPKPVDSVELLVRVKSMISLKQYQDMLTQRLPEDALLEPRGAQRPTVIIIAEEDENLAAGILPALEGQGCETIRVRSAEEVLALAGRQIVDILLLGRLSLDGGPLGLCRLLKEEEGTRNIQILVFSQSADAQVRVGALERGADDCLALPVDPREMAARVKQHAARKARLDGLQARYRSALSAAARDGLTGLANNASFKRLLDLEIKRSERYRHGCSLLILDVDDFKRKNDTLGHLTGDLFLTEIAQVLKAGIREIDIAARYGGDEFAVLLPHTDHTGAVVVADRLRLAVASSPVLKSSAACEAGVTVSVGVASLPADAATPQELICKADARLYAAKRAGKGCTVSEDV